MSSDTAADRCVIFAHPSADLYGSDLQLVESVVAVRATGCRCIVVLPQSGPLVPRLVDVGAEVHIQDFPVLRKAYLHPARFLRLIPLAVGSSVRLLRLLQRVRPDVVYVNTMTIPLWAVLARLVRRRSVVHVHEAENELSRTMRTLLTLPVLAGDTVIANSEAARRELVAAVPMLARRTSVIYNGVPDNGPLPGSKRDNHDPITLALVGRLSPRKGIDVAVEAVAILRDQGRHLTLELCGSIFPGYEWYEEQLHAQVADRATSGHRPIPRLRGPARGSPGPRRHRPGALAYGAVRQCGGRGHVGSATGHRIRHPGPGRDRARRRYRHPGAPERSPCAGRRHRQGRRPPRTRCGVGGQRPA